MIQSLKYYYRPRDKTELSRKTPKSTDAHIYSITQNVRITSPPPPPPTPPPLTPHRTETDYTTPSFFLVFLRIYGQA